MKTFLSLTITLSIALTSLTSHATEVINGGKGGHNTRHLLKRVDTALAESKPDLVVLMVGTNDALNSRAMVPVDEYRKNLLELIAKFRAADAQTVLMTIVPCHGAYVIERHGKEPFAEQSPAEHVAAINDVIREVAAAEKLPLVDLNHLFTAIGEPGDAGSSLLRNEANSNSRDGVHPTRDGYRVIATAAFQTLEALQKKPQRVLCFGDSITFGAGMEGAGTATGDTYPGMLARLLGQ